MMLLAFCLLFFCAVSSAYEDCLYEDKIGWKNGYLSFQVHCDKGWTTIYSIDRSEPIGKKSLVAPGKTLETLEKPIEENGEIWTGLQVLSRLTNSIAKYMLSIRVVMISGRELNGYWDSISIGFQNDQYRLKVGTFVGGEDIMSDILACHNGYPFLTVPTPTTRTDCLVNLGAFWRKDLTVSECLTCRGLNLPEQTLFLNGKKRSYKTLTIRIRPAEVPQPKMSLNIQNLVMVKTENQTEFVYKTEAAKMLVDNDKSSCVAVPKDSRLSAVLTFNGLWPFVGSFKATIHLGDPCDGTEDELCVQNRNWIMKFFSTQMTIQTIRDWDPIHSDEVIKDVDTVSAIIAASQSCSKYSICREVQFNMGWRTMSLDRWWICEIEQDPCIWKHECNTPTTITPASIGVSELGPEETSVDVADKSKQFSYCNSVHALGMRSFAIKNSQLSASSEFENPSNRKHTAAMGRPPISESHFYWASEFGTDPAWFKIDMINAIKLYALYYHSPNTDRCVLTANLAYSLDVDYWRYVTDLNTGSKELFTFKPSPRAYNMTHSLPDLIVRSLRLDALTSLGHAVVHVEVFGCWQDCFEYLGVMGFYIPDSRMKSSSSVFGFKAHHGRLYDELTWLATEPYVDEYLEVGLLKVTVITAVATQGSGKSLDVAAWVSRYKLSGQLRDADWFNLLNENHTIEFYGNSDENSVRVNRLNVAYAVNKVRFRPLVWKLRIAMRVELLGCKRTTELSNGKVKRELQNVFPQVVTANGNVSITVGILSGVNSNDAKSIIQDAWNAHPQDEPEKCLLVDPSDSTSAAQLTVNLADPIEVAMIQIATRQPMELDPIAYWPLNFIHGGNDLSKNANHAYFNDITYAEGPDGDPMGSIKFTGDLNSFMAMPNHYGTISVVDEISFCVWVYVDDWGSGIRAMIFTGYASYGVHATIASKMFHFGGVDGFQKSSEEIRVAEWTHFCAMVDSFNGVRYMIRNGKLDNRQWLQPGSNIYIKKSFMAGYQRFDPRTPFPFRLACMMVFDRVLTQAEILEAKSCPGRLETPTAFWPLDSRQGAEITGNGEANLTIINAAGDRDLVPPRMLVDTAEDARIRVSSYHTGGSNIFDHRWSDLGSVGILAIWAEAPGDPSPWWQLKLLTAADVYSLKLGGRRDYNQCITEFSISYGMDQNSLTDYPGTFDGFSTCPSNSDLLLTYYFEPFHALYIRVNVLQHHSFASSRYGIFTQIGRYQRFKAVGDVHFDLSSSNKLSFDKSFSLFINIKPLFVGSNQNLTILSLLDPDKFVLYIDENGKLSFTRKDANDVITTDKFEQSIYANQWYHVGLVYDSRQHRLRIHLDHIWKEIILVSGANGNIWSDSSTSRLHFVNAITSAPFGMAISGFSGDVACAAYYGRALSEREVQLGSRCPVSETPMSIDPMIDITTGSPGRMTASPLHVEGLDISGRETIVFRWKGCDTVRLTLMEDASRYYEFIANMNVTGYNDKIFLEKYISVVKFESPSGPSNTEITDCDQVLFFWISFSHGHFAIGRGPTPGVDVFAEGDDSDYSPRFLNITRRINDSDSLVRTWAIDSIDNEYPSFCDSDLLLEVDRSMVSTSPPHAFLSSYSNGLLHDCSPLHICAFAAQKDKPPMYFQIGLPSIRRVTAVLTLGRGSDNNDSMQRTTKYKLQYGMDGSQKLTYYLDENGEEKVFMANLESSFKLVRHNLAPPIEAKFVRFLIIEYIAHPSGRFGLRGCRVPQCMKDLLNGLDLEKAITGSGYHEQPDDVDCKFSAGVINFNDSLSAWCTRDGSSGPMDDYIQFDLGAVQHITKIVLEQNRPDQLVTGFYMMTSKDGEKYELYSEEFHINGGYEGNPKLFRHRYGLQLTTPKSWLLRRPMEARFVRFRLVEAVGHAVARFGIFGCTIEESPLRAAGFLEDTAQPAELEIAVGSSTDHSANTVCPVDHSNPDFPLASQTLYHNIPGAPIRRLCATEGPSNYITVIGEAGFPISVCGLDVFQRAIVSPSQQFGVTLTAEHVELLAAETGADLNETVSHKLIWNTDLEHSNNGVIQLSCPTNYLLDIVQAHFGVFGSCPDTDPSLSLTKVKDACQDQGKCLVKVFYLAMGHDPCSGVAKSVFVEYKCRGPFAGPLKFGTFQKVEMNLHCDNGARLKILTGHFGYPGIRADTNVDMTIDKLRQRCDGLSWCVFASNDDFFGHDSWPTQWKLAHGTYDCEGSNTITNDIELTSYSEMRLACPADQVLNIKAASFFVLDTCSDNDVDLTLAKVRATCQDQTSCVVPVHTSALDHIPCSGDALRLYTKYSCKNADTATLTIGKLWTSELLLSCSDGKRLNIVNAHFGLPETCPDDNVEMTVSRVRDQCEGKFTCKFLTRANLLGHNPCSNTVKVLHISYGCYDSVVINAIEHDTKQLTCSGGQVISTLSATYDQKGQNCYDVRQLTSTNDVKAHCEGYTSCSIQLNNGLFSYNTCDGHGKEIQLHYRCVQPEVLMATENNQYEIQCDEVETVILVSEASYYGQITHHRTFVDDALVKQTMANLCDGRTSCSFFVNDDLFQVYKTRQAGEVATLRLNYTCIEKGSQMLVFKLNTTADVYGVVFQEPSGPAVLARRGWEVFVGNNSGINDAFTKNILCDYSDPDLSDNGRGNGRLFFASCLAPIRGQFIAMRPKSFPGPFTVSHVEVLV